MSDEESSDESVAQEINNESASGNNDIIIECVENVSDYPNTKLYEFNNLFYNLEESKSRKYSKSLFSLATKHGVSRAFYDEFIKDINSYNEGINDPLFSHYRSSNATTDDFPLKTTKYDSCPLGCKMYQLSEGTRRCKYCKSPRYLTKKRSHNNDNYNAAQPAATIQQFSLMDMLALFIYEKSSRKELLYRAQYDNQDKEDGVYQDVFDGETYKEMKAEGHFTNPLDIALSLYTDGFSLGPNGQLTIVHFIILNLSPSKRYEHKWMIQTAILPGPKAPRNLFSYLKPLLSELETLQSTGILVKADDQNIYHARAHLLLATGDLPATTKMALHVGHTAKLGCRVCEVEGSPATTINKNKKEVKSGMYFIPQRNSPVLHTRLTYTKGDPLKGIKKKTRFRKLSSFKSPTFFGLDCMHLICHGIVRQFWKLIIGIYGSSGNPFYLKPRIQKKIGTIMKNSKSTIPSTFCGCAVDISQNSGLLRAKDWGNFIRYNLH